MNFRQITPLFIFPLLLICTLKSIAQQTREIHPLDDNDFECLKSLECAQNNQSLKKKGWAFVFDESVDKFAQEFRARMKGKNISFFALYDKQGYLIRSEYKRKNVALPSFLLTYLFQDNYKEWQLTGTELVMKDFDPATIKYKVVLENTSSIISKVYDFKFITGLDSKYEVRTKQ